MGCTSSKVDHEEKVARCKARKRFMKLAVEARHHFATSHAAYMQALKNVGAAFRQFGETELREPAASSAAATAATASSPPGTPDAKPPPRPTFLPVGTLDLGPAISEPSKGSSNAGPPLPLESAPPPPPPPKSSAWGFLDPFRVDEVAAAATVAAEVESEKKSARGRLWFPAAEEKESVQVVSNGDDSMAIVVPRAPGSRELVEVLRELDELFLKAYQSGKQAGKILEARKIHYHSNFVENRGFDSHSSKVLNAMSWSHWKSPLKKRSEEPAPAGGSDDDVGGHSGTLDRLLVWEKKLYEEMRTAEAHRLEYEKKCNLLRHQDSKGDYHESIDKTRNLIRSIQTRITVALEGVETAVAAIIKIRDEELYPQLMELQEGLTRMWADLHAAHEQQYAAVSRMRPLDNLLGSVEATSNIHRLATSQLEAALDNWYSCLNKLVTSQRDYMRNLSGWARLSVMPFEDPSSGKEINSPPPAGGNNNLLPPIHDLCLEWHQALDRLPDKVALEGVKSFVAVIHKIVELQNTELHHRKRVEALTKEVEKKMGYIESYERKHPGENHHHHHHQQQQQMMIRGADDDDEQEVAGEIAAAKSPMAERRAAVEAVKRKLEEEREQVSKAVYDTRAMTLNSLHTGLPSVFHSVAGFASVCSQAFQLLYYNAHASASKHRAAAAAGSFSP